MTAYGSMAEKLRPLGIYSLTEGSVPDSELKAYAEGIDPLLSMLDEMEREGFIPTAESYGLSERERFIEREKETLSVAERRRLLIGSELADNADATAAGFEQYLSDCGLVDFRISELPSRQRVAIYINDRLSEGQKSLINNKIAQAVPAHLNVGVYHMDGSSIIF